MSKANNVTVDFDHANTTASHVVVDTLQQPKNSMPDQAEKPDKIPTMKKSLILTIDDIPKDERDFDNSMIYLTKKYLKDLPFYSFN